ncbi:MAG: alginate export family protein [Bacteroidales bacterium]|nr:alginate export family protein [Bacteroidales bacterium]
MKKLLLIFSGLLVSFSCLAQFSISGDIFVRPEFRHGYRRMPFADEKPAGLVNQRTRLVLDFKKDNITTKVSFQDTRIWGQQEQRTQVPSFDLHEAWVQIAFTDSFLIRAGRQELRYENQRFFAINDWNVAGQKHDALLLKYLGKKGEFHLGAAFNQDQNRLFGTDFGLSNYKTLQYLWYQTRLGSRSRISFMGVADGYQSLYNPEILYVRGTWNTFLELRPGRFVLSFNPAYQHGKNRQGLEINAGYFMGSASVKLNEKIITTLGVEWFTGNDGLNDNHKDNAFDALYGAGHSLLGCMDYFTQIPAHAKGAGLINPYFKTQFQISPKIRGDANIHFFSLQNNYLDQGQVINKFLGTEVDLIVNYHFNEITQILAGYSVMFGTESMAVIRGGSKDEFAHWGMIMLRIRPKFL